MSDTNARPERAARAGWLYGIAGNTHIHDVSRPTARSRAVSSMGSSGELRPVQVATPSRFRIDVAEDAHAAPRGDVGGSDGERRAEGNRQVVRHHAGAVGHRPRHRRRRVPDAGRRVRLRQVDADPHHRRARAADRPASVEIDGRPIDHLRPHERRVAMVFQSYALYPHMSVLRQHRAAADDAAAVAVGAAAAAASICRRAGAA